GLRLVASASPDMGGIAPAVLVPRGTIVKLFGISEHLTVNGACVVTSRKPVPFQWTLIYRSPGGQEISVSSALVNATTLTPHFTAHDPGIYFATLTAQNHTHVIRIEVIRRGHGWV